MYADWFFKKPITATPAIAIETIIFNPTLQR